MIINKIFSRQKKLLSTINYLNENKKEYNQNDILNMLNFHLENDKLKIIKLATLRKDLQFLKKLTIATSFCIHFGEFKGSKTQYILSKNAYFQLKKYYLDFNNIEFDRNSTGIRQQFDNLQESEFLEGLNNNLELEIPIKNNTKNITVIDNKLLINNNKYKINYKDLKKENKDKIVNKETVSLKLFESWVIENKISKKIVDKFSSIENIQTKKNFLFNYIKFKDLLLVDNYEIEDIDYYFVKNLVKEKYIASPWLLQKRTDKKTDFWLHYEAFKDSFKNSYSKNIPKKKAEFETSKTGYRIEKDNLKNLKDIKLFAWHFHYILIIFI